MHRRIPAARILAPMAVAGLLALAPWYLALGPLTNVNERFLNGENTTWNDYVEHPDYCPTSL